MISSSISVTTTATLLIASTPTATRTIWIEAVDNDVHLGGSNVTTATGLRLTKGAQISFVLPPLNSLYAVVATGIHNVIVLKPSGDF